MEPIKKSPEMEKALEKMFGRTTSIKANVCANPPWGCGGPAVDFEDDLSRREYKISSLCQGCQNKVFVDE